MKNIAIGLLLLLTWLWPAAAVQAQDAVPDTGLEIPAVPELGQQNAPAEVDQVAPADGFQPVSSNGVFRVLAIGDDLGGGLGAGLTRLTESGGAYDVTNRFNESSGIARPEVYDWVETVQKITEDKQFDAVVVLLGTNDRQDIRLGQFRYKFNTPDWVESYKLQLDSLLDIVTSKHMQIYWVSLPPMADAAYDSDMQMLNGLFKERVTAQNGNFVDIRPAFLAADGSYTDRGPDDTGTVRKLRSRDGVGFYKEGNNRMAQLVLAALEERRKLVGKPAVAETEKPAEAPTDLAETPILGQSLGGGASETFDTKDIIVALRATAPKVAPQVVKQAEQVPAATRIIDVVAASGSASEKLLTTGVSPPAPAGRFDDYSYTTTAQ